MLSWNISFRVSTCGCGTSHREIPFVSFVSADRAAFDCGDGSRTMRLWKFLKFRSSILILDCKPTSVENIQVGFALYGLNFPWCVIPNSIASYSVYFARCGGLIAWRFNFFPRILCIHSRTLIFTRVLGLNFTEFELDFQLGFSLDSDSAASCAFSGV